MPEAKPLTASPSVAPIDDYIRELVRREAQAVFEEIEGRLKPCDGESEADELRTKLARIRAKEFVSIMEASLLLGCSDGHIRNLVRKAKKGEARHPLPFRDLDGVIVFKPDELLAWSEQPKSRLKSLPRVRGAGKLPALPAGPRLPERSESS